MNTGIAIIRLNPYHSNMQTFDSRRFHQMGIHSRFLIPTVKVYKNKINSKVEVEDKPLLLSYGFIELPMKVLCDREKLIDISRASEVISGFFYRNRLDVGRDLSKYGEAYSVVKNTGVLISNEIFHKPILVKLVTQAQVDALYEIAASRDMLKDSSTLEIGSFIILRKYPFEGLSAIVLDKSNSGKLRVELVDSGLIVTLNASSLLYSLDEDYLFNA